LWMLEEDLIEVLRSADQPYGHREA
jgi:hypothetical protein